jgi:hypothetical protein
MIQVHRTVPLSNSLARVTFSDGTEREIDLWPYVNRGGVFEPIRSDEVYFQQILVENDTISWPGCPLGHADIDPDVLYLGLPPNATEAEWRAAQERLA